MTKLQQTKLQQQQISEILALASFATMVFFAFWAFT